MLALFIIPSFIPCVKQLVHPSNKMQIQHFGMGEAVWVWRSRYVTECTGRACHCGYQLQKGMV